MGATESWNVLAGCERILSLNSSFVSDNLSFLTTRQLRMTLSGTLWLERHQHSCELYVEKEKPYEKELPL